VLRATRKPGVRLGRRREARGEGLKRAILDAARTLCFSEGVAGISARKIARRVGCSATAIYLHYRNLADVLHHLRMEGHRRLGEYFRAVDPTLSPLERLREMGRAYHRFGLDHPNYYDLMFLHRLQEPLQPEFVQEEIFTLLLVCDAVKAGQDAGVVRPDRDPFTIAHRLWSTMHGVTSLAVVGLLTRTAPGREAELVAGALEAIDLYVRSEEGRCRSTSTASTG
jgi:AcrR family transcriptional regulator